jgi:mannose/cellobiose epimerase-like protein (N-acyl-D-glucosamine 2-epimerase family)
MFDVALPFWAERGVDSARGGFVEQLTLEGKDAEVGFKRTRVTCRQIYAFSHGFVLGWNRGKDIATPGVDYLLSKAWLGETKGFARRLTRDGGPLDPTADLYDHAFVLFAFAWHFRATSDKRSRDWMHRTLDFIEKHMRHPGGEGFMHQLPYGGWRQQNPHMHLTEACLAAFEATGERRFADVACELAGLFTRRFFDARGTLGEYFDEKWNRAEGEKGRITEPGHQLEWAWILNACRKSFGLDLAASMRAAVAFAEKHGVDPKSHAVYNAVRDDGEPIDRGSRTWPNNERLKAAVALYELDGTDPSRVFAETNGLLFDRYLSGPVEGCWIDAFDENGKAVVDIVPASTLYHVFLAFAEVMRIAR